MRTHFAAVSGFHGIDEIEGSLLSTPYLRTTTPAHH